MIFPSQYMGKSLLIAVALYALLCAHSAAEPKPNVLFIAIDDLRNDLGALGVAHAKTPQLDAFAKTARVFTHPEVVADLRAPGWSAAIRPNSGGSTAQELTTLL